MAEFRRAFARLSPAHREALVLYAVQGMSLEEIAAVCGCTVQAVKSRMNRARTALKAMLLGEGGPAETPAAARHARAGPVAVASAAVAAAPPYGSG